MNEKTIKIMKVVMKNIAGIGITMVCSALVGNISAGSGAKSFKKACMAVSGVVIGGMIVKASDQYIDEEIDRAANFANQLLGSVERVNEATSEEEG